MAHRMGDFKMMKFYAGIGSRETPNDVLGKMTDIAWDLNELGWGLRSGRALGADHAFEIGSTKRELFVANDATAAAIEMASRFHPNWAACNSYARLLHGRNSMIILGANLDSPVKFVICWTKNGKASGGTGLGIRIAEFYKIPIFNLKITDFNVDMIRDFE